MKKPHRFKRTNRFIEDLCDCLQTLMSGSIVSGKRTLAPPGSSQGWREVRNNAEIVASDWRDIWPNLYSRMRSGPHVSGVVERRPRDGFHLIALAEDMVLLQVREDAAFCLVPTHSEHLLSRFGAFVLELRRQTVGKRSYAQ